MLDMLMVVTPDMAPQQAPLVIQVARSDQPKFENREELSKSPFAKGTFGVCHFMPSLKAGERPVGVEGAHYGFAPAGFAHDVGAHDYPVYLNLDDTKALVTILQQPKHGSFSADNQYYYPDPGFVGNDKAIVLVTGHDADDGKTIEFKFVYYFKVTKESEAAYVKDWEGLSNKYSDLQASATEYP